MRRLALTVALLSLFCALALPTASALATETAPPGETVWAHAADGSASGGATNLEEVAIWTIVGTLLGALALGILYLFKRRVGGFPRNPTWVAPISKLYSKDSADEGAFGDVPADAHGHH